MAVGVVEVAARRAADSTVVFRWTSTKTRKVLVLLVERRKTVVETEMQLVVAWVQVAVAEVAWVQAAV